MTKLVLCTKILILQVNKYIVMIETTLARSSTSRICYIILPEGLREDGLRWMQEAAQRFDISIAALRGVEWNDDLTPWPAAGVFKKAKPFAGHAAQFLPELISSIEEFEKANDFDHPERTLIGISLSGLFALWASYSCDAFSRVCAISGSLWYDGFADWCAEHRLSPAIRQVILTLGDREKNSKDARMSQVQVLTEKIVSHIDCATYILEPGITHFSPILPRLDLVLSKLL